MYDIVIIGAGIIGSAVAYNLGKYEGNFLVLEKENDVAMRTSKANSAIIHSGYDCAVNSLKAKLNVAGNRLYPALAKELNFPFEPIGSLVLAFDQEEVQQLEFLLDQGRQNGVLNLSIIDHDQIMKLEPHVNINVIKALYAPSAGIICPYEATLALAQSAAVNQVVFRFDYAVTEITKVADHFLINNEIETRYIINAAGIYSDQIAALIGDQRYTVIPRKGEYLLLDKTEELFHHVLFQTPTKMGKGVLITPTIDHNTLVGPTAVDISDKEDESVSAEGIQLIKTTALKTSDKLNFRKVITEFSGLRAVCGDDFIIEPSVADNHFINLIGIASPGLASAPAIGEYVMELLSKNRFQLVKKAHYQTGRAKPIRITELSLEQYDQLIKTQPAYGKIVCRCEVVSEQEIVNAVTGLLPAVSVDGVKRRTRAGMGRCQSGFCSVRTMELIARHQHRSMTDINKSTNHSPIVYQPTKGETDHED
ncbi:MAG: NAD(P)/FAD-dependent oxidoreductase [Erysipelotrichaceae bacterium]|nr:NAD(P)/FAD-dependent oxidoreductase [Erysipelotrichaceae bacterium]